MVSVSQQTKKQKMEMRNKKIFEKNRNNNQTEKEINMESHYYPKDRLSNCFK